MVRPTTFPSPLREQQAREAARIAYGKKVDKVIRSVGKLEDDAVREAMGILTDTRKSIAEKLVTARGYDIQHLPELEQAVDESLAEMRERYTEFFERRGNEFWEAGSRLALDPVEDILGIKVSTAGPNLELLEVMQGTTADLVVDITDRARNEINGEIRQAVLGVKRPFEAQQEIMKTLRTQERKGVRVGIAAQSESIIRTEMNRIATVAQFEEMQKIKEAVPDMQKQWITVQDGRQRDGHDLLHNQKKPMNHKFKYTDPRTNRKVELMYPRDPRGPAEAVISCRCKIISVRPDDDWTKPPPLPKELQGILG